MTKNDDLVRKVQQSHHLQILQQSCHTQNLHLPFHLDQNQYLHPSLRQFVYQYYYILVHCHFKYYYTHKRDVYNTVPLHFSQIQQPRDQFFSKERYTNLSFFQGSNTIATHNNKLFFSSSLEYFSNFAFMLLLIPTNNAFALATFKSIQF